MTEDSKIFSKKFSNQTIKPNLMLLVPGMNTGLSTIWLHMLSNQMEDSYGHAKITMVTFSQMLLPKVMVHLGS